MGRWRQDTLGAASILRADDLDWLRFLLYAPYALTDHAHQLGYGPDRSREYVSKRLWMLARRGLLARLIVPAPSPDAPARHLAVWHLTPAARKSLLALYPDFPGRLAATLQPGTPEGAAVAWHAAAVAEAFARAKAAQMNVRIKVPNEELHWPGWPPRSHQRPTQPVPLAIIKLDNWHVILDFLRPGDRAGSARFETCRKVIERQRAMSKPLRAVLLVGWQEHQVQRLRRSLDSRLIAVRTPAEAPSTLEGWLRDWDAEARQQQEEQQRQNRAWLSYAHERGRRE